LRIGSLHNENEADKAFSNESLFFDYMGYDATEDDKCKKCNLLPICMGGCPYERLVGIDRCMPYKYHIEELLKQIVIQQSLSGGDKIT